MREIAIIGGGAGGLAAAVEAASLARAQQLDVVITVYEATDKVGRSILTSGNGRCNYSNANIEASVYHNAAFVEKTYAALPQAEVLDFFKNCGLVWREEGQGRLYPTTLKASTVLDVLRLRAAHYGVREQCATPIVRIDPPQDEGGRFTLVGKDGAFHRAHAVIVACGGKAGSRMLPAGLSVLEQRPVLGALSVVETHDVLPLDNIRVRAKVSLLDVSSGELTTSESGEVLFRKYGVSGIAVFNVSRYAKPGDIISIDFLHDQGFDDAASYLKERICRLCSFDPDLSVSNALNGLLLPRVADAVLQRAGVDGSLLALSLTPADYEALANALTDFRLQVASVGAAQTAQVSRGGLATDELDPTTLNVRNIPGLYVVGELVDVDGPCGGYNLHWAWTSGILAARDAMAKLGARNDR